MRNLNDYFFFKHGRNANVFSYSFYSWLILIIPGTIFNALFIIIFNIDGKLVPTDYTSINNILGAIFFAPLLETFIIGFNVFWLSKITTKKQVIAIASAALFALLHMRTGYLFRFFLVLWPSYILSISYIAWRDSSFLKAYSASFLTHVLSNGTVGLVLYFHGA